MNVVILIYSHAAGRLVIFRDRRQLRAFLDAPGGITLIRPELIRRYAERIETALQTSAAIVQDHGTAVQFVIE